MATITKNNTFTAGATILAAEHNANFDTIYNDYNGNVTNANVAAAAAIAYSKLNLAASITAADADTSSVMAYASSRVTSGSFNFDLSSASGTTTAITGVGYTPSSVILFGNASGASSASWAVISTGAAFSIYTPGIASGWGTYETTSATNATRYVISINAYQTATYDFTTDGFTLTWTKTNTPTGTVNYFYLINK